MAMTIKKKKKKTVLFLGAMPGPKWQTIARGLETHLAEAIRHM